MKSLLHPSIPDDFLQYLLTFGYKLAKTSRWAGTFDRENTQVIVNHLKIVVLHYDRMPFGGNPIIVRDHEFTGIDKLDFIGWAMLMDLTGAVPIKELITAVSRKELCSLFSVICQRINFPVPGPEIEAPTLARQLEENN